MGRSALLDAYRSVRALLLFAMATPVVPWLRLRRILRDVRRTGRQRELLPRLLAPVIAGLACGLAGELAGYLFGPGGSARRKVDKELQRQDFLADGWTRDGGRVGSPPPVAE